MELFPSHCHGLRHDLLFSAVCSEISKSDLVHMSEDYFNNGYGPVRVMTLRMCMSYVLLHFREILTTRREGCSPAYIAVGTDEYKQAPGRAMRAFFRT
jgi:hypothetical protein